MAIINRRKCMFICVLLLMLFTYFRGLYINIIRIKYALMQVANVSIDINNISSDINNISSDIYIRSYVFDKRTFTIRFLVEMPMIFIKAFMESIHCIRHCYKRFEIPPQWIEHSQIYLYYNNPLSYNYYNPLSCYLYTPTTAKSVWRWKLKLFKTDKLRSVYHVQIFIECSFDMNNLNNILSSSMLWLQFEYIFSSKYAYLNDTNQHVIKVMIDVNKQINQTITHTNNYSIDTIGLCVSSTFHPKQS
eukprot:511459_1